MTPITLAHKGELPPNFTKPHWERRQGVAWETCSYCGSMSIDQVLKLLQTPGQAYSGADWKYGWPHKFYFGSCKFYAAHLQDATPAELVLWQKHGMPALGVAFRQDEDRLEFAAPCRGFQSWGVIGEGLGQGAPAVPEWFIQKPWG